jgi:Asp-tRNA(Asn)/Glu-tRNA(Gln) amidotransferase A subunit family amidase
LPLLARPFQHGVLGSIAFALPWHLSGYPTISLPLPVTGGPGVGPVLLVGEMGDDRGLLEQATAFVKAAC